MARGDPVFAKIDVDIFPNGERFSTLPAAVSFMYIAVWSLAVKMRTDTLPSDISTDKWLAEWTHKCPKSVHRWMTQLETKCLVHRNSDGSLSIDKVRSCHRRLKWDKRPELNI
jgi:hypothetical protein